MTSLANKNIVLGITGGIAAYKTPDLVRKLKAEGANVRVVLTQGGQAFVSPLSLQAVSGHTVSESLLDPAAEAAMGHIELAKWADIILVAPATAHCIAKLANGLADDLLTTLCLATTADIILAPAMNQQMWAAKATQDNLDIIKQRGVKFIGPRAGEQACGDVGLGRMVEPEGIVSALGTKTEAALLSGLNIVITAGPTREAIDPVRYISNHSSGKMGYALADAAKAMGANVTLVSGPVSLSPPSGIAVRQVTSAQSMLDSVMEVMDSCDIFIGCAAVADYRIAHESAQKIKKNNQEMTLTFIKNPDILANVASLTSPPFTLGFAAETENLDAYAKQKLKHKNLNMIAANNVSDSSIGFNSDHNALHVFWPTGSQKLPVTDKHTLAKHLLQLVKQQYSE